MYKNCKIGFIEKLKTIDIHIRSQYTSEVDIFCEKECCKGKDQQQKIDPTKTLKPGFAKCNNPPLKGNQRM